MLKGRVWQLFSSLSQRALLAILLSCIAILLLLRVAFISPQGSLSKSFRNGGPDTLVLYSFSYTDSLFLDNLAYFLNEGVRPNDRCQYLIIVQQAEDAVAAAALPELPSNVQYVFHDSECNDWGVWGWMLFDSKQVDHRNFKYFIFMTAAVRGPFLPAYAPASMHWTDPFLHRLTADVKLVGPTISCESSPLNGNAANEWRKNPHVQTYLVATDQVGLHAMLKDGTVFKCYDNRWNSIYHGELGSSAAVLNAGYNLGCLMVRYQGIDWRNQVTWDCNGRFSPQGENHNDGLTLDPLEVMFIKVKSDMVRNELTFAKKATKYGQWKQHKGDVLNLTELATNEYLSHLAKFKVPKILVLKARGSDCFDIPFYLDNNRDLAVFSSNEALWRHYVYFGQFEARPARFTCEMDYTKHLSGAGVMMSEAGIIRRTLREVMQMEGADPLVVSQHPLAPEGGDLLPLVQMEGADPLAVSQHSLAAEGVKEMDPLQLAQQGLEVLLSEGCPMGGCGSGAGLRMGFAAADGQLLSVSGGAAAQKGGVGQGGQQPSMHSTQTRTASETEGEAATEALHHGLS